jgi:hypothetical protein
MTQPRTHLDLAVLKREARRLPKIDAAWSGTEPEDRVALRAEWHDLMDIFDHLVATYDATGLDEDAEVELRAVAALISASAPALERMRLRRPDPDVLTRISLAAAS